MNILKATFVLTTALALSACVTSDPEYQAEKSVRQAAAAATSKDLALSEFKPLIPMCLGTAVSGQPLNDAALAQLGYEKTKAFGVVSYKKKRGTRTIDRINMQNTIFSASAKGCSINLGNFANVNGGGIAIQELLIAEGYTKLSGTGKGLRFQKGDVVLDVQGVFVGSAAATFYTIERVS